MAAAGLQEAQRQRGPQQVAGVAARMAREVLARAARHGRRRPTEPGEGERAPEELFVHEEEALGDEPHGERDRRLTAAAGYRVLVRESRGGGVRGVWGEVGRFAFRATAAPLDLCPFWVARSLVGRLLR